MDKLKAIDIISNFLHNTRKELYNDSDCYTSIYIDYENKLTLTIDVDRGGANGGNCWGDEAEHYTGSSASYTYDIIFDLYELIAPNISFVDARSIAKNSLTIKEESNYEYYGNYSERELFTYNFENVLNQLINLGYIEE